MSVFDKHRQLIANRRVAQTSLRTAVGKDATTFEQRDTFRSRLTDFSRRRGELISAFEKQQAEQEKLQGRFGGETISAPKEGVTYTPLENPYAIDTNPEKFRQFIRDEFGGLGTFLFGETERGYKVGSVEPGKTDSVLGRTVSADKGLIEGIRDSVKDRGAVKFLWQNILKPEQEKINDSLLPQTRLGYTREEAEKYATDFYNGNTDEIPAPALAAIRGVQQERWAWVLPEAIDFIPAVKGLNTSLKARLANPFFKQVYLDVMRAENTAKARAVLAQAVPELRGTKELEEIVSITRGLNNSQQLEGVIRQYVNSGTRTAVDGVTKAQRVFYENGIPLVRGGDVPSTTVVRGGKEVPSFTADSMALRTEIRNVLAGKAEAMRLSNLDVFADEIKAGALKFSAKVDEPVQMFVDEAVSTLRTGDRLATSKEVMKELVKSGKVRMIEVMPEDVVRLADGTFTYATKKEIGKRQAAAKAKREKRLAQAQATLRDREAAAKAKREERLAQAKATLRDKEAVAKKLVDETVSGREARISEVRANAKAANTAVREAQKTLRTLVTNIGKTSKRVAKERDKARRAIDRVRGLKTVDAKEKAKRIEKIRKERDRAIARIEKEKTQMAKQADKARAQLTAAKAKQIDVTAEVSKIRNEAKLRINMIKADTKAELEAAKQVVGEAEQVKQKARVEKAKVRNKETSTRLADTIKENFTVTSQTLGRPVEVADNVAVDAVSTTVTSPVTPVKGEGKSVANQIIQGFQDELEVIKRTYEERGLSLADLPDTHKAIGNPELLKKAFADLVADPYKVYNDFISGVFPDGTTRAAYGLALMKSDFVLTNPTRMDMVARTFMKGNTRIGQELQSIKVFGKMDYINIVGRFTRQADELLAARGINVEQEAAKLTKLFGDELDSIATVAKSDVLKAVDAITCKVE